MLGNVIPGSDRIPGSINTTASAAKTLPSTRSEVSAKLKLSQLSTVFNIAKEKLFLDLTLCKMDENCGENDSSVLVVDTSSDCCTNVLSISNSGKTLNEGLRANVHSFSMAKVQCSAT